MTATWLRLSSRLIVATLVISSLGPLSAQQGKIPRGAALFLEEMDSDLDGFIRAELVKQKIPLTVVLKREQAHLVMFGTSGGNEKRSWHEGWLTAEKDHAVGNVTVVDRATGAMLWADEAGDRSLWWGSLARGGQRKVASRIVDHLKKAIVVSAGPLPPPPPLSDEEIAAAGRPRPDTTSVTDLSAVPGQQKPLSNDDVVALVQAGLSEDLIIERIQTAKPGFVLDTEGIVSLKKAGVSEKIVSAMIKRQGY